MRQLRRVAMGQAMQDMSDRPTLDWRKREHWSGRRRKCVRCGNLTFLADEEGRPSHKVCAERAEKR